MQDCFLHLLQTLFIKLFLKSCKLSVLLETFLVHGDNGVITSSHSLFQSRTSIAIIFFILHSHVTEAFCLHWSSIVIIHHCYHGLILINLVSLASAESFRDLTDHDSL